MAGVARVRLGFEIGTGREVEIPIRHLAVTGQTQESGKTTTLEALIARSGRRALAFRTKRAEGAFSDARTVAPYFRERADWQFVAAILEATLRERLKFQRPWIMKVCRGTRTLADVQRAVQRELRNAKGLSESVYTELDAYLDIVVPQIARLPFASGIELAPGINVMDLTEYTTEVQALVIRSALEWIYDREREVIAIIPEAWEFLPQTRSSPVLLAAEQLIRKGAASQNFLWLDSQDIAGVHKAILRSVAVWILGVQREVNEIKRTLAHVHGAEKPKVSDVAHLARGQFIACFGHEVRKVYVQPAWLNADFAAGIATGQILDATTREDDVNTAEAKALRDENARLKVDNASLRLRIEALERDRVVADGDRPTPLSAQGNGPGAVSTPAGRAYTVTESFDNEALYRAFKARLIDELPKDPRVMEIVLAQPELRVQVKREVVTADGTSGEGWIGRLISEGFFEEPRTGHQAFVELKRRGAKVAKPSAYDWCNKMVRRGFLTEEKAGYQTVAGMKVNIVHT